MIIFLERLEKNMITRTVFQYGNSTRWLYNAAIKTDEDMMKWVLKIRDIPFFQESGFRFHNLNALDAIAELPAKATENDILGTIQQTCALWMFVSGTYSMVPVEFVLMKASVHTASYMAFTIQNEHANLLEEIEDMVDAYCYEGNSQDTESEPSAEAEDEDEE